MWLWADNEPSVDLCVDPSTALNSPLSPQANTLAGPSGRWSLAFKTSGLTWIRHGIQPARSHWHREVQRRWPASEDPTGSGRSVALTEVTEGHRGGQTVNSPIAVTQRTSPPYTVASDPDPFISCLVSSRTCGKYHL